MIMAGWPVGQTDLRSTERAPHPIPNCAYEICNEGPQVSDLLANPWTLKECILFPVINFHCYTLSLVQSLIRGIKEPQQYQLCLRYAEEGNKHAKCYI